MELNWVKGNKGKHDRKILVTTREKEPFSIFKTALLVNQVAINELAINYEVIEKTGNFFFRQAIIKAIEFAEKGIDWAEKHNEKEVMAWCKKYYLKFETIEPQLRKIVQKRLEEWS